MLSIWLALRLEDLARLENSHEIPSSIFHDPSVMLKNMKNTQSLVVKEMESLRAHIVELVNLPETEAPIISAYLDLLQGVWFDPLPP